MASISSQSWKNVVVGFGNKSTGKIADFMTCIVDHLAPKENSVEVSCHLVGNVLRLSTSKDSCNKGMSGNHHTPANGEIVLESVVLEHSPECPMRNLSQNDHTKLLNSPLAERPVMLAVAVLLESCDGKLLMTQRAKHMRSYPRAWVPPGGHVEEGESLVECGLRELHEETGLDLKGHDVRLSVLCMWEAVYPLILPLGLPRSHHVVVYMHTKVSQTAEQLQKMMKMDPEEVMANTWFTPDTVHRLRRGDDETMEVFLLDESEDGGVKSITRQLSSMFSGGMFWTSGQIYTGNQQALVRWSTHSTKPVPSKI